MLDDPVGRPSVDRRVLLHALRQPAQVLAHGRELARVQQLLAECGLDDRIHTYAITHDPAFDRAKRIGTYGRDRGV